MGNGPQQKEPWWGELISCSHLSVAEVLSVHSGKRPLLEYYSWRVWAEESEEPALKSVKAPRMPIPDCYSRSPINLGLFPTSYVCPVLEDHTSE